MTAHAVADILLAVGLVLVVVSQIRLSRIMANLLRALMDVIEVTRPYPGAEEWRTLEKRVADKDEELSQDGSRFNRRGVRVNPGGHVLQAFGSTISQTADVERVQDTDDLRPEYEFDDSRAKPNRFRKDES